MGKNPTDTTNDELVEMHKRARVRKKPQTQNHNFYNYFGGYSSGDCGGYDAAKKSK